jgi:hypothetical protein
VNGFELNGETFVRFSTAFLSLSLGLAPLTLQAGEYTGMARPVLLTDALYIDVSRMTRSSRPSCATRDFVRLVEGSDLANPYIKAKFAILLSAYLSERQVYMSGTGTCSAEGDELVFSVAPY